MIRHESEISSECVDFLTQVLKRDPNERMTFENILEHPWYKKEFSQFRSHIQAQKSGLLNENKEDIQSVKEIKDILKKAKSIDRTYE